MAEETTFEFETTRCMGKCPVQELQVQKNGLAFYEGTENIDLIGQYSGQLNKDQIEHLKRTLESVNFMQLKIVNDRLVKDLPSKKIYYKNDNNSKRITYYYPKNSRMEKVVDISKSLIKEIAWIKKEND